MNKLLLNIKSIISPEKRGKLFIAVAFIILIFFFLIPDTGPRNAQNSFIKTEEISPQVALEPTALVGKKFDDVKNAFGELINTNQINQRLTSQKFVGEHGYDPIQVVTDNTNLIVAVLEPSFNLEQGELEKLISENSLPKPDFEMYVLNDYKVKVYVFLSSGVAYEAAEFGGQVFHRIIFTPTDKSGFLGLFPNRYSENYIPPRQ